ncbi:hypothetical protein BJV74DRAFT_315632 [Russula compacta]|nr:hypothetical protein BJV74DRAFT_315632 [Russula compacta]
MLSIVCPTLHMPPPSVLSVLHIESGPLPSLALPHVLSSSPSVPFRVEDMTCGRTLIDILALIDAATGAFSGSTGSMPCQQKQQPLNVGPRTHASRTQPMSLPSWSERTPGPTFISDQHEIGKLARYSWSQRQTLGKMLEWWGSHCLQQEA